MKKIARKLKLGMAFSALLLSAPFFAQASIGQQLDLGASGDDVTQLQTFLAQDSTVYPEGLVTGYYGSLTAAAVSRYQTKNGLAAVDRVGPMTLALINQQMGGGGIGGSDDISAPILTPEAVYTSANSATFNWNSNEPAFASLVYGNSWPFLLDSAPKVSGSGGLSTYQTITVNGLAPHTTYYYVLMSTDQSGNVTQTVGKPFTTSNN